MLHSVHSRPGCTHHRLDFDFALARLLVLCVLICASLQSGTLLFPLALLLSSLSLFFLLQQPFWGLARVRVHDCPHVLLQARLFGLSRAASQIERAQMHVVQTLVDTLQSLLKKCASHFLENNTHDGSQNWLGDQCIDYVVV